MKKTITVTLTNIPEDEIEKIWELAKKASMGVGEVILRTDEINIDYKKTPYIPFFKTLLPVVACYCAGQSLRAGSEN